MPVYKDEARNTWYSQFYYMDWQGNRKKKLRRGFKKKKDAKEWENEFKVHASADMDMTFSSFLETYFKDKEGELKERTIRNKRYMLESHIIPYFGERAMNSITPADLINWQGTIRGKGYSQTYLRMIQNQMTALFTHAQTIYGLKDNPTKKVKKMGKSNADKLNFWTKDEYDQFIHSIDHKDRYYILFEILFWTGCREGEALALTPGDIDLINNRISIDKTYYRHNRQDIITTPKTEQSVRIIDIPEFLSEEIKEYIDRLYGIPEDERLFPIVAEAVQHKIKNQARKAGVRKIRVHDLRHSHVAFLIHKGTEPLVIMERLGHDSIKTTLNTYGHLYPNKQKEVASMLNGEKK